MIIAARKAGWVTEEEYNLTPPILNLEANLSGVLPMEALGSVPTSSMAGEYHLLQDAVTAYDSIPYDEATLNQELCGSHDTASGFTQRSGRLPSQIAAICLTDAAHCTSTEPGVSPPI